MRKNNIPLPSENETDLYFHIPFCVQKCAYCYFYSLERQDAASVDRYLTYLEKEIILKKAEWDFPKKIRAVYVGGGTPTYLSPDFLEKLFGILHTHFEIGKNVEFTMEVNPNVCDERKLDVMKKNGVNRLSFGIQTVDPELLKKVKRLFNRESVVRNIEYAKKLRFKTINLDFMFNLPNQTVDMLAGDVAFIRDLDPSSVYWYETKNVTEYMKGVNATPVAASVFDSHIWNEMKSLGYRRTMTEFYSKNDIPCRYTFDFLLADYVVSFGPFAISKYRNTYFKNVSDLRKYYGYLDAGALPIVQQFDMKPAEGAASFLSYLIRFGSADLGSIDRKFGVHLESVLGKEIDALVNYGFLKKTGGCLLLTRAGLLRTPDVQIALLRKYQHFLSSLNVFLGREYGLK